TAANTYFGGGGALDERKTDYKNPIDQTPFMLTFFFLHALFCVLFLYVAEWLTLVMSGPGLYDPTTIMNADILAYCQKEGWCKLAFYLLTFF
ncbi:hypothetical protein FD755_009600, partial [Muntiacus reevesi]